MKLRFRDDKQIHNSKGQLPAAPPVPAHVFPVRLILPAGCIVVVAGVVLLTWGLLSRHSPGGNQGSSSCAKASGPFTEQGATILQASGRQFIPYGTTVTGLANSDYQKRLAQTTAQITAAVRYWCVNTVRLQVAPDNLLGRAGSGYSKRFMRALQSEVRLAESYHLVVTISAQTEGMGRQPQPDSTTALFWQDVVRLYCNDPQVVFDLFNEPRMSTGNTDADWQLWQQGGSYHGRPYIGMQTLVNDVRSEGAKNLLWIEGLYLSTTLNGIGSHLITSGAPLMYDIHHPRGAHAETAWDQDFGYLVKRSIAPVVDGEWTNYAAPHSECWPDAKMAVPAYLNYLQGLHVGMTVWTLQGGVMTSSSDLSQPTQIGANWQCRGGINEGAGSLVMQWYKRNNG
ncbi:MAG TPA: cellulase family glycosylhydrolase [Candidatus Saccharimonadales bacterium]|nr:cellulase family glycosylhydrolase [Candidatus Saccharimonadales bacterium]